MRWPKFFFGHRTAARLEEYPSIPAIAEELELIGDVQTDEWWDGVTLPALESVRVRLRLLVQFIEKRKRKIVYTDFVDEMGDPVDVPFASLGLRTVPAQSARVSALA